MELKGIRAALVVGPLFEDVEATYPLYRLREAGADVEVSSSAPGTVRGKKGQELEATRAASDVSADELDVLVLPGGYGPDKLRMDEGVLRVVRGMHERGKPIAFICHAGWIPASAGIVRDREVTSYRAIADDMRNAGARWRDAEAVVDGNRAAREFPTTCRRPCARCSRSRPARAPGRSARISRPTRGAAPRLPHRAAGGV